MIERLRMSLRRLPIKWKLMLGATALIFLIFSSYNLSQYVVLKQWMMKQEKDQIQVNMIQLEDYFHEKLNRAETLQMTDSRSYLEKIIGKNQLIRIIDKEGTAQLTVTNHFNESWVSPKPIHSPELFDITYQQEHILIYRSPLITSGFVGTIELASNLETFDHFSQTILWVMLIGGVLAIFISGIGGLAIARQFMHPIRTLASTMLSVKENGLKERVVQIENGDELSSLAKLFNELMNQLEASFRQQKQFVEDASHELRTPITILEGHLSLLDRWGKSDPVVLDESLSASLQETRRLKGIVQELLTLTKAESQFSYENRDPILLEPIIHETIKRLELLHPDFAFKVNLEKIKGVFLSINPLHVEQILLIVLDNAVKYTTDDKRINIEGIRLENEVQITIMDYGIGIPQEELTYIFDRFYRVDKARSRELAGTGLGLSIAKRLMNNHQGEITVSSQEKVGTKVSLRFPIS
ncbi:HAMP domain-containing protein [Paenibacillus sp. 5J-6]|uniref:Signal transduction histidine-protein kinase ArlS n=1 Tax=Paenibacillus silvestris TaxID=2606219 RepID=A0A6L8V507_9BACL|nr:HAMP domain-containing histidine kinase [Paenibacillus silvestris]MZQ85377.1 HAMP domain-containing protein [Paenibacillus silvestris]